MPKNPGASKQTFHNVKASTQYKREHKSDYGHEKIEILYEDKDIVVINKASGLLSVPYPGSRVRTAYSLLENIMRKKGTLSSSHHPCIVHRLDRDTSGVMMFALNENVQQKIMNTWHRMVSERLYHAVAENPRDEKKSLPPSGLIDDPLAQNAYHVGYVPSDSTGAKDSGGKKVETVPARTHYKIICRGTTHSLFELSLDTGKKNQIRAHLSSKGYPLAGDENYRAHTDPFHRLALHARTLEFTHPVTQEKMKFEVPEPEEWIEYVKQGDPHPKTPIWRQSQNQHTKKESAPAVEGVKRISRKQSTKMDFIAQGKLRGKH